MLTAHITTSGGSTFASLNKAQFSGSAANENVPRLVLVGCVFHHTTAFSSFFLIYNLTEMKIRYFSNDQPNKLWLLISKIDDNYNIDIYTVYNKCQNGISGWALFFDSLNHFYIDFGSWFNIMIQTSWFFPCRYLFIQFLTHWAPLHSMNYIKYFSLNSGVYSSN